MLDATLAAHVLDPVTAATSVFDTNALLSIDESGLEIRIVPQARHAWVDVSLSKTAFESYDAAPMQTSLDTDAVAEFTSIIKRPTDVTISIDPNKHTLTLESDSITYNTGLIDSRHVSAPPEPTNIEQRAEFVVSGEAMNTPLELANLCGAQLTVGVDDSNDAITGVTDDFDDRLYFEIAPDDARTVRCADIESTYAVDILVDLQRTFPDDATVHVALVRGGPMTLSYPIADENGMIAFTTRPRV
jgi:hypothetical protein